jgi:hypothetical protein
VVKERERDRERTRERARERSTRKTKMSNNNSNKNHFADLDDGPVACIMGFLNPHDETLQAALVSKQFLRAVENAAKTVLLRLEAKNCVDEAMIGCASNNASMLLLAVVVLLLLLLPMSTAVVQSPCPRC